MQANLSMFQRMGGSVRSALDISRPTASTPRPALRGGPCAMLALACCLAFLSSAPVGAGPTVIIESRVADGTQNPLYTQSGPAVTSVKSTAAGLSGTGSYYAGDTTPAKWGEWSFTPAVGGFYDVHVTWGNNSYQPPTPTWTVNNAGSAVTVGLDQTSTNGNAWVLAAANKQFNSGTAYATRLTTAATGLSGKRTYFDSVRWTWKYPNTPTGLTATVVSISQVNLSWTAVGLPTGGYYKIERDGVQIGTSTTNSYNDTAVPCGTHTYRVRAFETGDSGYSNTVTGVIARACDIVIESQAAGQNYARYSETELLFDITAKSTVGGLTGANGRALSSIQTYYFAQFNPDIPVAGYYDVYATWGDDAVYNREWNSAKFETTIWDNSSVSTTVDQTINPNTWVLVANDVLMSKGSRCCTRLMVGTQGTDPDKFVLSDAVKYVHVGYRPAGTTKVAAPSPGHLSAGNPTSPALAWAAGANNVSYDVYFSPDATIDAGDLKSTAQYGLAFSPGALLPNTTYYWRVNSRGVDGTVVTGDVWSFTTGSRYVNVLNDGFDGSLGNWTQGASPYTYSTAVNHATYTGPGGAYSGTASHTQMYHPFSRPFAQCHVSGWFYDTYGGWCSAACRLVSEFKQTLSLRDHNCYGGVKMFVDNAVYNEGAYIQGLDKYCTRLIGEGGNLVYPWTSYGTRYRPSNCNTPMWVQFETLMTPDAPGAAPVGSLQVRVTDPRGTHTRGNKYPDDYFSYGVGRITVGTGVTSEGASHWDDVAFDAIRPVAPTIEPAQANSKTQISWYWNRSGEINHFGFDLMDETSADKGPVWSAIASPQWLKRDQTSWQEGGLTPNAPYRRKIHAWNGELDSEHSSLSYQTRLQSGAIATEGGVYTYPWAQAGIDTDGSGNNGNVWCSNWSPGPTNWHKAHPTHQPFVFTNPAVFGTSTHGGSWWKASAFEYVWDQNPTLGWPAAGSAAWSSGDINPVCTDDGAWYLHVRAKNANGEWNNVDIVNYGPFMYDRVPPVTGELYSTSVAQSGSVYINFNAGSETPTSKASGLHPSAPYKVNRPEGSTWDSGWAPGETVGPNWLRMTDTASDILAGGVATYTMTTRDLAGNESVESITARRPIDAVNQWVYTGYGATLAPPGMYPDFTSGWTKVFSGFAYSKLPQWTPRVHGMSSEDGRMLWVPRATAKPVQGRVPGGQFPPYPAAGVVKIFAGSQDNYLYCIDAADGDLLWQHNMGDGNMVNKSIAAQFNVNFGGTTYDLIFAASCNTGEQTDNFLRFLNAANGQQVAQFGGPGSGYAIDEICGGPAVAPSYNTVYFTSMAGTSAAQHSIWAVNTTNGALRWSHPIGNVAGSVSTTPYGDKIYAGTTDGKVYSYLPDGTQRWVCQLDAGTGGIYGASAYNSGKLYVATLNDRVYRINDGNGTIDTTWGSPNGYVSITSPSQPVPAPGINTVYVGSGDGNLYELNMSTGAVRSAKYIGYTIGDPTVDPSASPELIYVGTSDGRIHCFTLPF